MRDNLFLICDSVSSILRKLKTSSAVSDLLVLFCLLAHHTPPSYDLMTFILCFYFIFLIKLVFSLSWQILLFLNIENNVTEIQ